MRHNYPRTRRQTARIVRLRRQGFRLWAIAKECGISVNDVVEQLVDAGEMNIRISQAWIGLEGKQRGGA